GTQLLCRSYVNEENTKNFVIVHGFTEFSEKYREMVWYYYHLGYNVYVYDQRGHGLSHREIDDLSLVHVSSFEKYVEDLHAVLSDPVASNNGKETVLFGHSMGGAVVLLYLMRYPNAVQKAILSSPMIAPCTHNIPRFLVLNKTKKLIKTVGETAPFPYAGKFDPKVAFEQTADQSRPRFMANMALRLSKKEYQSSTATNGWMYEALAVQRALLNRKSAKKITVPILIMSAEQDRVVKNRLQKRASTRFCNSRMVTIEGATHNIFAAGDWILQQYYGAILDFLQQ
ncbi:MAG: alpha/beta hydrolase, partial [Clostridia bacterium]|nr:alpha/beta hydrolase [Clostridia bacterium]